MSHSVTSKACKGNKINTLWSQSQRLWYLLPITLAICAILFFVVVVALVWFDFSCLVVMAYHLFIWYVKVQYLSWYRELVYFYSNLRVLHIFKLNQISSTRSIEDVVIFVRWETSFGREGGKTQTDLQLCIITDLMKQVNINCLVWGQAECLIWLLSVAGL